MFTRGYKVMFFGIWVRYRGPEHGVWTSTVSRAETLAKGTMIPIDASIFFQMGSNYQSYVYNYVLYVCVDRQRLPLRPPYVVRGHGAFTKRRLGSRWRQGPKTPRSGRSAKWNNWAKRSSVTCWFRFTRSSSLRMRCAAQPGDLHQGTEMMGYLR